MPGLGDEFRAAREARHLSLSDVSEHIHIRSVYLQNIEAEEWSSIAAPVYLRGFLRTYARFLGLDPEDAVRRLNEILGDAAAKPPEPQSVKPIRTRSSRSSDAPSPWLWVALVVAVLLVGFVAYQVFEYRQDLGDGPAAVADATPTAAEASAAANTSAAADALPGALPEASGAGASAAPASASAAPKADRGGPTLIVSITQTSWLLVKVDGAQIVEGIYPPGTVKEFHGKSASIRAGNAGGVELIVNGKHLGPLGAFGSVVDKTVQLAEE